MVLVRAEARPSAIHGLGLFTLEPIPKGQQVTNWDPMHDYVLSEVHYKSLPKGLRRVLDPYVWLKNGLYYGTSGVSRYTNHSSTPNLVIGGDGLSTFAARDIAAGEELTEDYGQYDESFTESFLAEDPHKEHSQAG